MGTPLPISYRDIEAWSRVTGHEIEAWELAAIIRIDNAYLASVAEQQKQREAAQPRKGR